MLSNTLTQPYEAHPEIETGAFDLASFQAVDRWLAGFYADLKKPLDDLVFGQTDLGRQMAYISLGSTHSSDSIRL